MTKIKAGDVTLDYEIDGDSGDWLVMIQGIGYAKWGWSWNVPGLSERFRVITFDNRGVGLSDSPAGPYTAKQMAGDAAALLDALGVERAHVAGVSLGGFISIELAIARPDLVESLILGCTGLGGPDWVPMPEATVRLLAEFPSLTQDERIRRSTENVFSKAHKHAHPEDVDRVVALRSADAQGFEPWSWQSNAGATFDASDRADQIACRTLVVTGDEDNVVDPDNSAVLAGELKEAMLVQLPGGHVFFIEHPDRFNALVTAFCTGEAIKEVVVPA